MTRVPITSPLAVLATRTTQEHLMATHSTTDLKPGDIVQHPTRLLNGLVVHGDGESIRILHLTSLGIVTTTSNLIGWERVESTPPAVEPEIVGDGCECWVTPEHMWMTHYGAVEPGSQVENNPRCPKHGEKPTTATVTLYCPDCGEAVTDTATVGIEDEGGYYLTFANSETHTCPPAQPDEPQEFGAKATVAQADGHIERWLNMHAPPQGRRGWLTWDARDTAGSTPGQSKWADWSEITQRGTVTIGWDE